MSKKLKYVESIIKNKAAIFKKHLRWQVQNDRETLVSLLKTQDWNSLEFYEKFYEELSCKQTNYTSQVDLMNYVGVQGEIPETIDSTNMSIGELHEEVQKRNSAIKKQAWAETRAKKKTKSKTSLDSKG